MLFTGISLVRGNSLLLFLPLVFITTAYSYNQNDTFPVSYAISVSLNKTPTWGDKELYRVIQPINATTALQVNLTNPDTSLSFVTIQVHSQKVVSLCHNECSEETEVDGRNVGLYSPVSLLNNSFFIINGNDVNIFIYLSVHGYLETDPIPGGCNMEFPTPVAPYMKTSVNKDYITVDLAPPRGGKGASCQASNVTVHFYQLYFTHRYTSHPDVFFIAVQNMITLNNINYYGHYLPETEIPVRRRIATYRGVGVVYGAIAISNTDSSAYSMYVPKVVYSCDPMKEGDCQKLHGIFTIVMVIMLYLLGLFLCYFGHYFFKTEMFLVGTVSGMILAYIGISWIAAVEQTPLVIGSLISGTGFGLTWLLLWWYYGKPLLSVYLATFNVGLLCGGVMYYCFPGYPQTLLLELDFWMLVFAYTILMGLTMIFMSYLSNVLCSTILGAYAVVFAMSYFLDSTLNYIVINMLRRTVIPKFSSVIIAPPFVFGDWLIVGLFVVLVATGVLTQYFINRGRAPFPPPPRSVRRATSGPCYGAIDQENCRYGNEGTSSKNPSTGNLDTSPLLA